MIRLLRKTLKKCIFYFRPNERFNGSLVGTDCLIDENANLSNVIIGKNCRVAAGTSLINTTIGDFSYISLNSHLQDAVIGKFCSIGMNVRNHLGQHPTHTFVSTHPIFYSKNPKNKLVLCDKNYFDDYAPPPSVEIGHDVWIGYNVLLGEGVKIGHGAIIGAYSVVTKDVPPYAIYAGRSIVRYRFTPEEIDFLLAFQWWDKDVAWLKDNLENFHDISRFMDFNYSNFK